MDIALSVAGIYLFIFLGFFGKRHFAERIHERTLVLVSVYLLQPMLVFWGLTHRPIDRQVLVVPLIFLAFLFMIILIILPLARRFFPDIKDRSVVTVASLIGNTGNLGIPLGIALFGESSVIYTSIINLANVFLVYTLGVYFYSRGSFSVSESFGNIFRLPAIWFGIAAIAFNLGGLQLPEPLQMPLKMGAFATMVLQLMIFGIYLATVKVRHIRWRMLSFVGGIKFLLIPFLAYIILRLAAPDALVFNILLLELIVPMAVMNVNLAALYDCKADQVAFLTFATSLIFLAYLLLMMSGGFQEVRAI